MIAPATARDDAIKPERFAAQSTLPAVVVQPDGSIHYPVHPKQGLALQTEATDTLFGGAAGGGKSHLLRIAGIRWCLAIPGLQCYLFRRLHADLKANHIEGQAGFKALLSPWMERRLCNIIQSEIQFFNGARIYLRHFQNENALTKYRGVEIHLLLMDEATHFLEMMFLELRARCRVSKGAIPPQFVHLFPKIILSANPGGVGHTWVKRYFVDAGPYHVWKAPDNEGGGTRVFIPSRVEDNPSLTEADPGYVNRLRGLKDPALVRALLEGDWNVVAGSMFGDVWRQNDDHGRPWHVSKGFAIPYGWDLWRACDDGYANPAAVYWFTQDPDTDTVYVIDELYAEHMLPEQMAEEILKRDREIVVQMPNGQLVHNGETLRGIIDPAAFADQGQQERSGHKVLARGAAMNALGCHWSPAAKGPGSRRQRAQHLHRVLAPNPADARRPGIVFFARCFNAIRTIPILPRDKHDNEAVAKEAEDHCFDAVTYGLQWQRSRTKLIKLTGV